ncbi:MAG: site-specific integrase [Nitrososphaerales archaeon]
MQDWFDTLMLSSANTARIYLRVLNTLRKELNIEPTSITKKDIPIIRRWLLQRAKTLAPKSLGVYVSAIENWFDIKRSKPLLG